eukprot:g15505.t1
MRLDLYLFACVCHGVEDVVQLAATGGAFAARTSHGVVVTWGDENSGGDSLDVWDQLSSGVVDLCHTSGAFAARKGDGSVVTWGDEELGGNSFHLTFDWNNVKQLSSTGYAFAAVRADGTVISWGDPCAGGDCTAVSSQLVEVRQIYSTYRAFAAVKDWIWDGKNIQREPKSDENVHAALQEGVLSICGSYGSFAAVKGDGTALMSRIAQAAQSLYARGCSVQDAFAIFDYNRNGFLDQTEFYRFLIACDCRVTLQESDLIFAEVSKNTGRLDINAFAQAFAISPGPATPCSQQPFNSRKRSTIQ